METIAERLSRLRKHRKLKQVDVAAAADVDRSSISKYETGGDVPGRDTLMKLAEFYGVSIDWLAAGSGLPLEKEAARARNEEEALLLWAFRTVPTDEASAHLNLLVSRAKGIKPSS